MTSNDRPYKKPLILLVDDMEVNIKLALDSLEEYDCHISKAYDGREAKDQLNIKRFDLVLLDYMLPFYNGRQILEHIRVKLKSKVPVLILSSQKEIENVKKLMKLGINGYLVKPYEKNQLIEKIVALIDIRKK